MSLGRKQQATSAADERGFQFDVRRLEHGDAVDVFVEDKRCWARGTFEIRTDGSAMVLLTRESAIEFELALRMGLRRVLH